MRPVQATPADLTKKSMSFAAAAPDASTGGLMNTYVLVSVVVFADGTREGRVMYQGPKERCEAFQRNFYGIGESGNTVPVARAFMRIMPAVRLYGGNWLTDAPLAHEKEAPCQ